MLPHQYAIEFAPPEQRACNLQSLAGICQTHPVYELGRTEDLAGIHATADAAQRLFDQVRSRRQASDVA